MFEAPTHLSGSPKKPTYRTQDPEDLLQLLLPSKNELRLLHLIFFFLPSPEDIVFIAFRECAPTGDQTPNLGT